MSEHSRAVFLSYASEDAAAAQRICESLRAAGIEVWFDRSELVGGDVWDQKIRRQIKDCALLMPIISRAAEARSEGYFRLEWRLADQRTHLMAKGRPFLVPVVIDETRDADAQVPDSFTEVQWTRLHGGVTPPAFVQRVQVLLAAITHTAPAAVATTLQFAVELPQRRVTSARPRRPRAAIIAAASILLATTGYLMMRASDHAGPTVESAPAPPAPPTVGARSATLTGASDSSASAAKAPPEESVAVLPFDNLSDAKQNEYFSDGISEELLTVLQKIPGLKVSARTSSFSFKGGTATAQEIGAKLGVAYLVEGSVRRAGKQVRITARLSHASTGEQLWSESYTRDLKNVFAVQSELALAIVAELRGRLTGGTDGSGTAEIAGQVARAQKGGTDNAEAHEFYLQGQYFAHQPSLVNLQKATGLFQRAVKLDPSFALAWANLGRLSALSAEYSTASSEQVTRQFASARAAAERSLKLDPNLAEGYLARYEVQSSRDFDWRGAHASIQRALELAPSDAMVISNYSQLASTLGQLLKATQLGRQAVELDPVNSEVRYWLAWSYLGLGQLGPAEQQLQSAAELSPSLLAIHRRLSLLRVYQGRFADAIAEGKQESEEWSRLTALGIAYWAARDIPAADAALARLMQTSAHSASYQIAELYAFRGDADASFKWLDSAHHNLDPGLQNLRMDPIFKGLRKDPRWSGALRQVGLADEQLVGLE